ncbi:hypothetical protein I6H08_20990 [Burkholderia gladioli]|uniref:hypothetical protein n=1 Tax=Burkholderia gladioli TaxID=28095 RepID=UPI0019364444|nr:hypothetical protein [Burkholderia gladioli]QPQ87196.1 hypothetical protein I6H08_20990 [Burkholderia gladioli]
MQEMRRFPGANFPEFAAIHFGIRNLRVSTADKLARLPINQRFPRNLHQCRTDIQYSIFLASPRLLDPDRHRNINSQIVSNKKLDISMQVQ